MFKCYETERKSAILRASFILHLRQKKLKRSSIHVDLKMSFCFVCLFFPKDRWICVLKLGYRELYLVHLSLPHVAEQEVSRISHIYFSPLISDHSVFSLLNL